MHYVGSFDAWILHESVAEDPKELFSEASQQGYEALCAVQHHLWKEDGVDPKAQSYCLLRRLQSGFLHRERNPERLAPPSTVHMVQQHQGGRVPGTDMHAVELRWRLLRHGMRQRGHDHLQLLKTAKLVQINGELAESNAELEFRVKTANTNNACIRRIQESKAKIDMHRAAAIRTRRWFTTTRSRMIGTVLRRWYLSVIQAQGRQDQESTEQNNQLHISELVANTKFKAHQLLCLLLKTQSHRQSMLRTASVLHSFRYNAATWRIVQRQSKERQTLVLAHKVERVVMHTCSVRAAGLSGKVPK